MFRKNTAGQYLYFCLVNASTGAALTGATVTGKRAIDGGAQANVTGTISETAGGQYVLALSQADTNGNNIGLLFTATSAVPVSIHINPTAADPTNATTFGLGNLDAAVSSRSTYAGGDTSGTTTLLSRLTSTRAGNLDNLDAAVSTRLATSSYTAPPSSATIAGDVWDVALSGHLTSGSTGAALNAAGSAGDPWSTTLPGAYSAGTAGYILGTNLDAMVSDLPTATENADALLKRDMSAVTGEASRSLLNAIRFLRNKWSSAGGTLTVTKEDDSTTAWTATLSTDSSAEPITGSDPS